MAPFTRKVEERREDGTREKRRREMFEQWEAPPSLPPTIKSGDVLLVIKEIVNEG